jgi:hypothetical protein
MDGAVERNGEPIMETLKELAALTLFAVFIAGMVVIGLI